MSVEFIVQTSDSDELYLLQKLLFCDGVERFGSYKIEQLSVHLWDACGSLLVPQYCWFSQSTHFLVAIQGVQKYHPVAISEVRSNGGSVCFLVSDLLGWLLNPPF